MVWKSSFKIASHHIQVKCKYLQHLCTFRGRKKVVISSFPDFKGKVQVTAIYQNIYNDPKIADIVNLSELWETPKKL